MTAFFDGYNTQCSDSDQVSLAVNPAPHAVWYYQTIGLSAQFFPVSTNEDTYTWNFGDGGSSNAPNPIHNYPNAAFYTVELTTTNACGSDFHAYNIQISDTSDFGNVGIEDLTKVIQMSLFPNPATDQLSINLEFDRRTEVSINIYNSIGQQVKQVYQGNMLKELHTLDIANFENGVYFLQVITPEQTVSKPFIKK